MKNIVEIIVEKIIKSIDPEKIILFGSRANGSKHEAESDYDICVIKKGVEHRRKCAQHIYKILYGVGASVDVIVETPDKFDELKDNPFLVYQNISKHGEVLYEKQNNS